MRAASSIRVMVVEDFHSFRQIVCSELEQRPELRVICGVSDGLEAVHKARELRPDLLACWSIAAIAQAKSSFPDGASPSIAAGEANHRFNLEAGATLPDLVYIDFNGAEHRFSDLHAKYRLIDFWATWCALCVEDLPSKMAVYQKYHRRD